MYGSNMFQLYTLQTLQKPFAPQLPCEITVPLDKLIDTLSGKQVLRAKSSFNRGTRIKQQQESGMAWTLVSICICHSPWYKACTRSLTFSGLLDHVPAPHSALKQSFWPVSLACDYQGSSSVYTNRIAFFSFNPIQRHSSSDTRKGQREIKATSATPTIENLD